MKKLEKIFLEYESLVPICQALSETKGRIQTHEGVLMTIDANDAGFTITSAELVSPLSSSSTAAAAASTTAAADEDALTSLVSVHLHKPFESIDALLNTTSPGFRDQFHLKLSSKLAMLTKI